MQTHRDVLNLWPSLSQIARDLTEKGVEITPGGVLRWKERDEIPALYWPLLVEIAVEKAIPLTLEMLALNQRRLRERTGEAV